MFSLATSETRFSDVPSRHDDNVDIDPDQYEKVRVALREMESKIKSRFKERNMFPLVRDMWFYSENHNTGEVQLMFRGKGMLSRRH